MRSSNNKNPWSRPLADLVEPCIGPVLARYGFGEADIITCWPDIVGERVASCSEPVRLQWSRRGSRLEPGGGREPATLILRVEGGGALELQHMAATVVERINTHLGWRCVGRLAFRQGPLQGRTGPKARPAPPDPGAVEQARAATGGIVEEGLREALVRLGARALKPG